MTTKTLTIMEDAYDLLAERKAEGESFSEEIRRLLTKKGSKSIWGYYGILSEEEGNRIVKVLKMKKKENISLKKRHLHETFRQHSPH